MVRVVVSGWAGLAWIVLAALGFCLCGCQKDSDAKGWRAGLPDVGWYYRVDPYLRIAEKLQRLDIDSRVIVLRQLDEKIGNDHRGMIVLCRMLFCAKDGKAFRRPHLGELAGIGETEEEDWPLEPIALVDGIPFSIVFAYSGAGALPETGRHYLDYCLAQCNWSNTSYRRHSRSEKLVALGKLMRSGPWRRPLLASENADLQRQIEDVTAPNHKP